MDFKNCFGIIWSVSTLARSSVTISPRCVLKGFMSFPCSDVNEMAGDGGCRGHVRAHQVRAPALALAAFEVAIRGGGAALADFKLIRIHPQTHAAAGLPPLATCGL